MRSLIELPVDPLLRGLLACGASCLLLMLFGRHGIAWLRTRFREPIKTHSATISQLHAAKAATPTLGGVLMILAFGLAMAAFADLSQPLTLCAVGAVAGFGLLGMYDDLVKLFTPTHGLGRRGKLLGQIAVATLVAWALYATLSHSPGALDWRPPGLPVMDLGLWWIPFAVVVMVAFANAVNLTDGLDGLASGCIVCALPTCGWLAYTGSIAGSVWCTPHGVAGADEMLVAALAMTGAVMGFLWFNRHPARVFMGDCGSQALGGLLAVVALAARQEAWLLLIAGVFVIEAASVAVQIAWFKMTGNRVFRCAPLHHHFQFLGWPETKIVTRFWIAALLCAVLGLSAARWSTSMEPFDTTAAAWRTAGQATERID